MKKVRVSRTEIVSDIRKVARLLSHSPSSVEYKRHGRFDSETMRRRSNKKHWEDAVAWLTGFDREEIKYAQARGGRYCTTQQWLSKLRSLSLVIGHARHAPTTGEANKAGINAHELCL